MESLLEACYNAAKNAINLTAQNNPGMFLIGFLVMLLYFRGLPTTFWRKVVRQQNGTSTVHGNMDTIRSNLGEMRDEMKEEFETIRKNCTEHWKETGVNKGRIDELQRRVEVKATQGD